MKDELKELRLLKSISDSIHTTKTNRLKGQVEVLKNELTDSFIRNKLGLAQEILWEEIKEAIKEIWPSINIIFTQSKTKLSNDLALLWCYVV